MGTLFSVVYFREPSQPTRERSGTTGVGSYQAVLGNCLLPTALVPTCA